MRIFVLNARMEKVKSRYHKLMYVYHYMLYRDCRDRKLRMKLLRRALTHKSLCMEPLD